MDFPTELFDLFRMRSVVFYARHLLNDRSIGFLSLVFQRHLTKVQKNDLHRARIGKDRYFLKRLLLVQICIDLPFYQRILTIRRFICVTENNDNLVPVILIGILETRRNIRSSMRVDGIKSIGATPNIQFS